MKEILILGAVGIGVDILDSINEINSIHENPVYKCLGFLDDDKTIQGKDVSGLKVLGTLDSARNFPDAFFICGIGNPSNFWMRDEIIAKAGMPREKFETIVHPTASVSKTTSLGAGSFVMQNVSIAANSQISDHVIIMPNSVVSHDCVIGDYCIITAGVSISGYVKVGRLSYFGTNSATIGYISIGDYCQIGMGSIAHEDVPDNQVVIGNPARFLRPVRGE